MPNEELEKLLSTVNSSCFINLITKSPDICKKIVIVPMCDEKFDIFMKNCNDSILKGKALFERKNIIDKQTFVKYVDQYLNQEIIEQLGDEFKVYLKSINDKDLLKENVNE